MSDANTPTPENQTYPTTQPRGDVLFRLLCQSAAASVIVVAIAIVVVLIIQTGPMLGRMGEFLTGDSLDPNNNKYGALAYIYGTLITSFWAMVIALPLGVLSAAYLAEIASPKVRRAGSFLIELLAAIPSVVYGFWGLFFIAPFVQMIFNAIGGPNTGGSGITSASLILAIMIVPYITAITFDVCRAVPRSQREGALALGATRWQMIRTSVLPFARPGIIAAGFLALGRALGETMAVTMLVGNRAELPQSMQQVLFPFFSLGDSIASVIANQLNETSDETHRSALVGLGLLLFFVTILVNMIARLLIGQSGGKRGGRRWFGRKTIDVADIPAELPPIDPEQVERARVKSRRNDQIMTGVMRGALLTTVIPLFLILGYICYRGIGALNMDFFTDLPQSPAPGMPRGGLAHAFLGSLMLVGLASLFAVPLGILAAIFLAEYKSSRFSNSVRFVAELLGGVPSIVIGIFAYAVVVRTTGGFSGWAGAFALGIMMIPIVVRSTEESLKLVPTSMRHASYALGGKEWQTTMFVSLPAAMPAIITGVFLAVGRIAGETAPLLLTAYGSNFFAHSPGDRTPFLPKYIYDYSRSGIENWEQQAWAAALVLVAFIMILNVGIRYLAGSRTVGASRAD